MNEDPKVQQVKEMENERVNLEAELEKAKNHIAFLEQIKNMQ